MYLAVSFLAIFLSLVAICFSIVALEAAREKADLRDLGDPTAYTVVTDGRYYRVRGPFDTFYTIRFSDLEEARKYAAQLASWYDHLRDDECNWRAAA